MFNMKPVDPNYDLTRWEGVEPSKIAPADIYAILKKWKDKAVTDSAFDSTRDYSAMIAREISRTLNDKLEKPEYGEILYFPYTTNSTTDLNALYLMYSDRIESIDEMRDARGILQQYRVLLKRE